MTRPLTEIELRFAAGERSEELEQAHEEAIRELRAKQIASRPPAISPARKLWIERTKEMGR